MLLSLKSRPVSDLPPLHLRPTAELAERVLLPGDPGRALALAQALLSEPRMFNHHRGLWGYTGTAPDGHPATIQSTGMGGPSAAIVLGELIALGARRAVRVGTCRALAPRLGLGELVLAGEAICADGASRALGGGELVGADEQLTAALARALPAAHRGTIVSLDLPFETGPTGAEGPRGADEPAGAEGRAGADGPTGAGGRALAADMESAALFALGRARGTAVASLLAVSHTVGEKGDGRHIEDRQLLEAAERMGRAALAALAG